MKLYGSETSPYVRKLRILIKEKGLACEFVIEGPADAAGHVAALNPLGKVPVLLRDAGDVLFDSPMIAEYLDSLTGEPLLPLTGEARWVTQRWHALGQGIMDAVVTRMQEGRKPAEKQTQETIGKQEGKIAAALKYADAAKRGATYLVDDRFSLADIALGVALEYIDLRYPHAWRAQHPRLALWQAGMAKRASFLETLPPEMKKAH
jgi:glutathione S-transferase